VNGVPPIMNDPTGQAKVIDSLRSLLKRLSSPELMLPEAKLLRSQISQVLGEISPDRDRSQVYRRTLYEPAPPHRSPHEQRRK
jgi:hypothetical protein